MAKGVFVHRADSKYDDVPEEQYQFPKRYLKRAQHFDKDWIVYYEPRGGGGRMGYTSIAKVERIVPDPAERDMFIARIAPGSYLEFEEFVRLRSADGLAESELERDDGSLNQGLIQWAIRPLSDADFAAIVRRGLPEESDLLPRADAGVSPRPGMEEFGADFIDDSGRDRLEQTVTRKVRDRAFRRIVLDAYDSCCAITGLRIINGLGRAEVEAAHIRPVEAHGPDAVRNGIALSGTVHWMFDRGLIGLSDDLDILVSRQVNDPDSVHGLINPTGKAVAPDNPAQRPHPRYLGWHRENRFKV